MTEVLAHAAFAARVAPFVEARVLDAASVHVVDLLASPDAEPDVLLGLALAVRAPREGHVGVRLADVDETLVVEAAADDPLLRQRLEALPWPADRVAWQAAVEASPLVGQPGERRPFVMEGGLVLTHRYWSYQDRLCRALQGRAAAEPPGVAGGPLDLDLLREGLGRLFAGAAPDDRQRLGALAAVLRGLTVISGGPGTGKTYTVKKILALLFDQWTRALGRPPRVALAAPTGKAAVRMKQALAKDPEALPALARGWVADLQPRTIHRLLGFLPGTPTRFRYGAQHPLPHEVVVVDEASMVDLALMCKLVEAVPPGARLVLLGDRNQLASVEAGSVLADVTAGVERRGLRYSPAHLARVALVLGDEGPDAGLLDEAAPPVADGIVHFTRPYRAREGSGVQAVAYAIARGELEQALAWLQGAGGYPDLGWLDHGPEGTPGAALLDLVEGALAGPEGYLARLRAGPAGDLEAFYADVLERLDAVRVLAAHRRGPLGVEGLNRAIGERLGLSGDAAPGRPLIVTENSYEVGVMNGDVGVLVQHPRRGLQVVFPGPEAGTVLTVPPARLPAHETVFAMTVHKSQGSEFAHTVLVLPDAPSPILTRELVYTGLTRARERVTVAGDPAVLAHALGRTVRRASGLGSLLWGERISLQV